MIRRVTANQPTFKTVEFTPGLNIVWADRTKESTKKDSRNGLGKSTLIEIIHFCLGASTRKGKGLMAKALHDWEFTVELDVGGKSVSATRSVRTPRRITVAGDAPGLVAGSLAGLGEQAIDVASWTEWLGQRWFGLPETWPEGKYRPSFRSLVSYFVRRGKDAFSTPFEHHRKQKEWDKQLHNAFLLQLCWEDAAAFQVLKDRRNGLKHLRQAAKEGAVEGMLGTLGELEAQRVRLAGKAAQEETSLTSFRVHPQYAAMREQANQLTAEIHEAVNANTVGQRLLDLYQASRAEEAPPDEDALAQVYADAGVALPGVTLRALAEVREFHQTVLHNRRAFLEDETQRLAAEIEHRERLVADKTEERAAVMEVLQTHGALEEYTMLQRRHLDTVQELNAVEALIRNVKALEDGLSQLKIDQELLLQRARRDFDERQPLRDQAIAIFNGYSEALYSAPGRLIIDPASTGFTFDIEIERSSSAGIDNMKVFCYDLMLAHLWSKRPAAPGVLIHDSTIFDGVDERQRALALELAAAESQKHDFQYICTLNSDNVPYNEFSPDFSPEDYIRLRLTDADVSGCLLGVRF